MGISFLNPDFTASRRQSLRSCCRHLRSSFESEPVVKVIVALLSQDVIFTLFSKWISVQESNFPPFRVQSCSCCLSKKTDQCQC